jgi:hypothetical protein
MKQEGFRARVKADQEHDAAVCARLVGLARSDASVLAEGLGHKVEVMPFGGGVTASGAVMALPADMDRNRVTLFYDEADVVARALLGECFRFR